MMSAEINNRINILFKGYKQVVAQKKQDGIMSITEGKAASMSFNGYCATASTAQKLRPEAKKRTWFEAIFAWAYITLTWNLIGRAASVGNVMLQHVTWEDDCMKVMFAKHKGLLY